jgi:two-component system LytT family sensor kinase
MNFLSGETGLFVFTLLLKVGAAAAISAIVVRSATFRKVLYTEVRDYDLKVKLMLFLTPPLALGILLRFAAGKSYDFADLMLEGAFILGLLGGRVVGPLGGALISLPAFLGHEWLSMPVAASAGLVGGLVRQFMPNTEDIWSFGPFTFLGIPRSIVRLFLKRQIPWGMLPMMVTVGLEIARQVLGRTMHLHPRWFFYIGPPGVGAPTIWQYALIVVATMMAVAVPLKIWNNTRIEMNLEQHQQLLLKARLDALSRQINPHFLFNTLNTVASLIRFDPDMARVVVVKLSNILRKLLRKHETFVALRDELSFIDDYLDIEVVRFGRENLQVFKEVDEHSLDAFVPSMMLQPIVENSLKHGLAGKLGGGQICIRTTMNDGRLAIEIEDNGAGIPEERLGQVYVDGIGISNVHERLKLLYGADFQMDIHSREGEGTRIRIEVPEVVPTPSLL